ncbi:MAG TPA: lantibiotic immunity ABC transporter MutG family permease subunit [Ruminiclostridium sp.]
MTKFFRFLQSDALKIKRQPILLIHLLVPLVGMTLFLGYYSFSPQAPISKVGGFLQVLAVTFPTLIGIVCSMTEEQESLAGNFQQMLTASVKLFPFFSKLLLLLLLGFGAVLLSIGGFGSGFLYILHGSPYDFGFYLFAACILFGSNIFLYILHFIVSLRFGNSMSIGIGIVESLLSALLLTGLGNGIWQFIPCAWAARFITIFTQYMTGTGSLSMSILELHSGIWFCLGETMSIIIFAYMWFLHWEGRKSEE